MKKIKNNTKNNFRSPFKDISDLQNDIITFANKFRTHLSLHSKRISDYFEMSCYNDIINFYELNGFRLEIKNLQNGEFRYKCSTSGIQSNFSHFLLSKKIEDIDFQYELQHNLAVQSSHDDEIFTTPDISLVKINSVKENKTYYETKRTFSYIDNNSLISFFEAKHYTPFPELIFNFIGIVNELKKDLMDSNNYINDGINLAPCLMVSGKENKQTAKIKKSLERRYRINIIFDMFYKGKNLFLTKNKTQNKLYKI